MYVAVHVNHSRGMHFVEENNLSLNSVPTNEIGKPCRAHNKSIITAIQYDCFDLQSLTNSRNLCPRGQPPSDMETRLYQSIYVIRKTWNVRKVSKITL